MSAIMVPVTMSRFPVLLGASEWPIRRFAPGFVQAVAFRLERLLRILQQRRLNPDKNDDAHI